MRTPPFSQKRPRFTTLDRRDYVARPATTAAMLRRTLCCVLALSTPYAMFLLNGALRP